jgi:hypothetical protein
LVCLVEPAVADPVLSHHGSTSPPSEGWIFQPIHGSVANGPVLDGGAGAWRFDSAGDSSVYYQILTPSQHAAANSLGWRFSGTMRLDGTVLYNGAPSLKDTLLDTLLYRRSPNVSYELYVGGLADGTLYGHAASHPGGVFTPIGFGPLAGERDRYHTYTLIGKAGSLNFDFWMDGTLIGSNLAPRQAGTLESAHVSWGIANGPGVSGSVLFRDVTFEIGTFDGPAAPIPEPGTWVLIALGAGLVVLTHRKTASRGAWRSQRCDRMGRCGPWQQGVGGGQ